MSSDQVITDYKSRNRDLCKAIKLTNSFLVLRRDLIAWLIVKIKGWSGRRHFECVLLWRCATRLGLKDTDHFDQARKVIERIFKYVKFCAAKVVSGRRTGESMMGRWWRGGDY